MQSKAHFDFIRILNPIAKAIMILVLGQLSATLQLRDHFQERNHAYIR